ncbi:hypothetical protein [Paenibacillus methanolicus]|uniref:Uncharacterized protein n=1 Tax=Paenibacillus methanolicus TaxID=582686 RepID=A0A5S5BKB4_9BACL|nr:hypothetical protein [Paenibacillus methanolicus]TYP67404.1 hypothetical protein BCM02_12422 [Paenibacillus methanolicus]
MSKRIESEVQYNDSLKWMTEKAVKLADPLFQGEERDKMMRTYDYVSEQVLYYKRMEREGDAKKPRRTSNS